MKIDLFFWLLCISYSHTLERGDLEEYGIFEMLLNSDFVQCSFDKTLNIDVSRVNVYFYDFTNNDFKAFLIHNAAEGILAIPDLDTSRKSIIYVPGSTSNITSHSVDLMRNAFKAKPYYNLIVLDYIRYTKDPKTHRKSYKTSVRNAYYIGKALAGMLKRLTEGGIAARNMHCIGHSLGGQILGYTGFIFYEYTGEKLWRVTALDPAGPCFSESSITEQTRSGAAEYVEIYHCNAGGYGTDRILGDIDFFLNKDGQVQPECGTPFIPTLVRSERAAMCNHITCVDVWAATVRRPDLFVALKCDSYDNFRNGYCSGNNTTRPGFWNPGTATGTYYFDTDGYDSD